MKSILSLALLSALTAGAFAQGSLTPPAGAPAPVFKTLNQVEARTPVNTLSGDATAVHVITVPGSYYLTGPITGNTAKAGIRIEAVNVTLDLNGFTIDAVVGSLAGITANAPGGPLVVRNGMIRSFNPGIDISNSTQFLLQDIQVVSPQGIGVKLDGQGTAERVSVVNGKSTGIEATATSRVQIRDCRVDGLAGAGEKAGIRAPLGDVSGCSVSSVSSTVASAVWGIYAPSGSVSSCRVQTISSPGNVTGAIASRISRSVITDVRCTANNGATGIGASGVVTDTSVSEIHSASHTAYGIHTTRKISGCEVSAVSGTLLGVGMEQCDEVTDSLVSDITGNSGGLGIRARANGLIARNRVVVAGTGIAAAAGNRVLDNQVAGDGSTGTGISTFAANVRIEGNHAFGYGTGITAVNSTLVVRNSAGGNTTNYSVAATVVIVTPAAMGTNPHANISQ